MRELNRELNLEIEKEYTRRRNLANLKAEQKTAAIHQRYPEILELEQSINLQGVSYLQLSLKEDKKNASEALERLEQAKRQLAAFLSKNNLASDYSEPDWLCPKCQDTGMDGDQYCSCYELLRQKLLTALLPSAVIPEASFENCDLDIYPEEIVLQDRVLRPRDYMRTLKDIVRTYCEHFSLLENRNLFFSGQEGSGKSWLISCIATDVKERGYNIFMLPAAVFFDLLQEWHQLKSSFRPDPERYKEVQLLVEAIWACDLLLLDDLGTELQRDGNYADLLLLLDDRQRKRLHTVIASNLSANDLHRVYDKRIASRISGNFLCYQLPSVDLRLETKK